MRVLSFSLLFISLAGCNSSENPSSPTTTIPDKTDYVDTTFEKPHNQTSEADYDDSRLKALYQTDTSTLAGKRKWILDSFDIANKITSPEYDTVLDLNYDGHIDYVIGYYGQSGTGIKNGVDVFIYDQRSGRYIYDEELSSLPNPTFYINQKKITWFYLGNGGGNGGRIQWRKGQWISTKEFDVTFERDSTKWKIFYPLSKKSIVIYKPYQFIPPEDILETGVKQ
jgi:hypothetical protein